MSEKTIFDEVRDSIHAKCNSNFHYSSLSWNVQIWVKEICRITENRLRDIERKLEEKK